ncbi:MAG: hypothetical protein ACI4MK_09665, partial [Aristaeellaceae bacterium]
RVFDYESKGRGFESRRAHQKKQFKQLLLFLLLLRTADESGQASAFWRSCKESTFCLQSAARWDRLYVNCTSATKEAGAIWKAK